MLSRCMKELPQSTGKRSETGSPTSLVNSPTLRAISNSKVIIKVQGRFTDGRLRFLTEHSAQIVRLSRHASDILLSSIVQRKSTTRLNGYTTVRFQSTSGFSVRTVQRSDKIYR